MSAEGRTWVVVGDGPWGDALSRRLAANGQSVLLVGEARSRRKRASGVQHTLDVQAALEAGERVVVALPPDALEDGLRRMADHLRGDHRLVTSVRGLTLQGRRPGEAVFSLTAVRQLAVIAGAASAAALAKGAPAALVVGSAFPRWAAEVQAALVGDALRVYTSPDPIGVELANVAAAVLAVAMGAARTLGVGAATEATALTRALAEMDRLVTGLGGRAGTAFGLAGLGVITEKVFAGAGEAFEAGAALAAGDLEAARSHRDLVAMAERLQARAAAHGLRAPMVDAVAALFAGALPARQAVAGLMARGARSERG